MTSHGFRRLVVRVVALLDDDVVYLLVAYAKAHKSDLTSDEKKLFSALIEDLAIAFSMSAAPVIENLN